MGSGNSGWSKYAGNPVYGAGRGICFDVCVYPCDGEYRLYFSWRPQRTVALACGPDGIRFGEPRLLLKPPEDPAYHYNRLCVLPDGRGKGYRMYVTYQYNPDAEERAWSVIQTTVSADGLTWDQPLVTVLVPDTPWEKQAVMCPSVLYDRESGRYRMWYSGGAQYEPDAIGYAESTDGVHFVKSEANPLFQPDPDSAWEQAKVTACQVLRDGMRYRMFYIGFEDVDTARIGMAVSDDGFHWRRCAGNPLIAPSPADWDRDACYKPYALREEGRWRLWYNGRTGPEEQICLAVHPGLDLDDVSEYRKESDA